MHSNARQVLATGLPAGSASNSSCVDLLSLPAEDQSGHGLQMGLKQGRLAVMARIAAARSWWKRRLQIELSSTLLAPGGVARAPTDA